MTCTAVLSCYEVIFTVDDLHHNSIITTTTTTTTSSSYHVCLLLFSLVDHELSCDQLSLGSLLGRGSLLGSHTMTIDTRLI